MQRKPLLRKAFCGFAVHAAKSDYSLRGLRPPNPQGFFDRLGWLPLQPSFYLPAPLCVNDTGHKSHIPS